MTNNLITQLDVLASLQQEVGGLPRVSQAFISEALKHVPGYWNSDAAEQPFDPSWEMALREQICRMAHIHLAMIIKARSVGSQPAGTHRANLNELAKLKLRNGSSSLESMT